MPSFPTGHPFPFKEGPDKSIWIRFFSIDFSLEWIIATRYLKNVSQHTIYMETNQHHKIPWNWRSTKIFMNNMKTFLSRYLETEGQHRRQTIGHLQVQASERPRCENLNIGWSVTMWVSLVNISTLMSLNIFILLKRPVRHPGERVWPLVRDYFEFNLTSQIIEYEFKSFESNVDKSWPMREHNQTRIHWNSPLWSCTSLILHKSMYIVNLVAFPPTAWMSRWLPSWHTDPGPKVWIQVKIS